MKRSFLSFAALLLALGSLFGEDKVPSKWTATEIKIDGADAEWVDAINFLEKEKLGFGIKNDSSYLYLCLKFDPGIRRQAMMFGFTVWLDATGKNKRTFGVRYPIGLQNFDADMPEPLPPDGTAITEGDQRFAPMLQEVEVLGPEKDDRNRFSTAGSFGLQAATADSQTGYFVCELKLPLRRLPGKPYAIGANAGQTVSIGFEMGQMDREKMRERMMSRGGAFGGARPSGGGRPGRSPGGGPEGRMKMSTPFKVWTQVTLAGTGGIAE